MTDHRSDHPFDRAASSQPGAGEPERPRVEPEIIPPGAPDPDPRLDPRRSAGRGPEGFPDGAVFVTIDRDGQPRYTRIEPPGPISTVLGLVILGAVAAGILLVALGVVLFWVPVAIVVVAALVFSGYLRGLWRRFMGR
ncbi:hypothetical protein [Rhodoplanes serenus]|uniref:hypothetical protein n=1 Tax=Rhodoplanes serenus TaxID=200615 RepID=UPI0011B93504|nr:hypothetical protein [Rhodoplanes serenus]